MPVKKNVDREGWFWYEAFAELAEKVKPTFDFLELCQCFNIDVKNPRIFSAPNDTLFGFSVLQHEARGEKS